MKTKRVQLTRSWKLLHLRIDVARGANLIAPPTMSDRDVVHSAGVRAATVDALAAVVPGTDRHGRIHT